MEPAAGVERARRGLVPPLPRPLRRRVQAFDDAVDQGFDRIRGNRVADRVFYGASALGDHSLIWLLLGAARGLRSSDGWHAAVRVGAGVAVESAVVNGVVKSIFRRSRPVYPGTRPLRLRTPRTSSFPSGHATSAFTASQLLADRDPLWPAYYAIAAVVAWSRVYVRIHHASDVVAGMAFGVVLGRVIRRVHPLPSPPEAVLPPGLAPGSES